MLIKEIHQLLDLQDEEEEEDPSRGEEQGWPRNLATQGEPHNLATAEEPPRGDEREVDPPPNIAHCMPACMSKGS